MNISTELEPPDFTQCQVFIRQAHGPFKFGPKPKSIRCTNTPVWIAVEIISGADGLHGAMSLCQSCAEIILEDKDLRIRTQLQPIFRERK